MTQINYETKIANYENSKIKKRISRFLNFLKLYIEDFTFSSFFWLLAVVAFLLLFQDPIKRFLSFYIIEPLFSFVPEKGSSDIVFGFFFLLSLLFLALQLSKRLIPSLNSIVFGATIILLYLNIFRFDNTYTFYHFSYKFLNKLSYDLIFLVSSLIFIFTYKSYLRPLRKKASQYSLIDDYSSNERYADLYGRTGFASSIAEHISKTSTDVSFAIGIIGDWGSGKTDFMLRLKASLEKNKENITFEFNPWMVNNSDAMIVEFFKSLTKKLKPYNQTIANDIRNYSNRILKPARETQFKLIDTLIGSWFHEEDIQEQYKTINKSIKSTSKRIVIFIDDVDRLSGKEIMEVLRIIRNTANFSNTFFIVGIDQNYIINALKNTKSFANEAEYLKKVFQLTITLPAFKKDSFVSQIKKYLFTKDMDRYYKKELILALTRFGVDHDELGSESIFPSFGYESIIQSMIDNIRDLKRFCNSFKIVFNILKDEADLHDLLILELIRNKNIEVYNSIRNKELINWENGSIDTFILDVERWKKIEEQLPENDRGPIKRSLDFLFSDAEYKNQRKLILFHNFYIYFSYQLFNFISLHEFNMAIEKDEDGIVQAFQTWIAKDRERELLLIVSNLDSFKDALSFKKMALALLMLSKPESQWFAEAKQLICQSWEWNQKHYFDDKREIHKEFFCSILKNDKIDIFIRALLAHEFLYAIIHGQVRESDLFISRREIKTCIYCLFHKYLNSTSVYPETAIEFYYLNDWKAINDKAVYYIPATRSFKNYLLSNADGFQEYLKRLMRPSQSPYIGSLVFDPWLTNIFGDWQTFEKKLLNTSFENEELNKLKKIILTHLPKYFTDGRNPITIENEEESKFIDEFLKFKRRK